jgi:hypothetical protein
MVACMGDRSMQDSLENFVQTIVAPGLGSAELILGLLVAFGFLVSAVWSLFAKGDPELEWWERR